MSKKLLKSTATISDLIWQHHATVQKPQMAGWNSIPKVENTLIVENVLFINQSHMPEKGYICICAHTEKWKTYIRCLVVVCTRMYQALYCDYHYLYYYC